MMVVKKTPDTLAVMSNLPFNSLEIKHLRKAWNTTKHIFGIDASKLI